MVVHLRQQVALLGSQTNPCLVTMVVNLWVWWSYELLCVLSSHQMLVFNKLQNCPNEIL